MKWESRTRWWCLVLLGCLAGCGPGAGPAGDTGASPAPVAAGGKDSKNSATKTKVTADEFRLAPFDGPTWFTDATATSGIDFRHAAGDGPQKPFPAANGSGVAAFDYDLDGRPDLLFATGTPFPLDPNRHEPRNRAYRQVDAAKFVDVTDVTGLGHNGYSAGLAVGDFDSDGFPDVYVSCYGPNQLYRNQGDGTFEIVTAGVENDLWGASAAWLDIDEDGLLDLYVCNYGKWTWDKNAYCGDAVRGVRMHCGPRSVDPQRHGLYRNRGDGTFDDYLEAAGIDKVHGRGQGVLAADLNQDGHVDLYVGNDLNPNFLFFGEGSGTFRNATETSGAAYDSLGREQASMGVDAADIDGDGRFELFVTNFQHEYNTLYQNLGDDQFQDSTNRYGLVKDALPWIGWGTAFIDFNLDGALDLIVTNGHVDDNRSEIGDRAAYRQPALLYRGDGKRFTYLAAQGGEYFTRPYPGRGLAVADFDVDGDQDVIVGHQDEGPALLLNNELSSDAVRGRSLSVRLIGTRVNRNAIGATVIFRAGERVRHSPIKGGGSYLSASELRLVFAVLPDEQDLSVEVRWPGGRVVHYAGLAAGRDYALVEPGTDDESATPFCLECKP